jgi:hypothetical protein
VVVVVVVAAGVGLAACGSSPDNGGDADSKKGGSMRIGSVLPESYDPVLFQMIVGNQALQLVYKGLVTYTDAEGPAGTKLIPVSLRRCRRSRRIAGRTPSSCARDCSTQTARP